MKQKAGENIGVKILNIIPASPADRAGLQPGDRLMKVGEHPLEDILDLQFYLEDGGVELEVERDGYVQKMRLDLPLGEEPGWEVEPLKPRSCKCRCIFCFIDQLPAGLRPALYLKDEDYRFSFLFGNYLTLVGLTGRDFERIVRLRLSPLYVSIHATDPAVRGRLLGLKSAPVLPHLKKLIQAGIRIHGQIVVVPGENDGRILEKTLEELTPLYPGLASLSVVPVGLTAHRISLPTLRLLNAEEAGGTLEIVLRYQRRMLDKNGSRWVYPADELLLLTGTVFPSEEAYEDYPQIENGVGIVRWTLRRVEKALEDLPEKLNSPRKIIWVTAKSAYPILKSLTETLQRRVAGLQVEVVVAENRLLGSSVTVAGLLGGEDITKALEKHLKALPSEGISEIFLPPDCINLDGLLLDDWPVQDISQRLGMPVRVFDGDWRYMVLGENGE